jgi:hypothetical protein
LLVALVEDNENDRNELLRQIKDMKRCKLEYARNSYDAFFEDSENWSYRDYNPHLVLVDLSLGRGQKQALPSLTASKSALTAPKSLSLQATLATYISKKAKAKA